MRMEGEEEREEDLIYKDGKDKSEKNACVKHLFCLCFFSYAFGRRQICVVYLKEGLKVAFKVIEMHHRRPIRPPLLL